MAPNKDDPAESTVDLLDVALADALEACASGKDEAIGEIARRLVEIGASSGDPDAWMCASELYALIADLRGAESALDEVIREVPGISRQVAENRLLGVRVLAALGPELAALTLAAGQVNAQHSEVRAESERRHLERRMRVIESRLERAGLSSLSALAGGFDLVLETYWGRHYVALFKLALALETLASGLFPQVERGSVIGVIEEALQWTTPLVRAVAGREVADRLRDAVAPGSSSAAVESARELARDVLSAAAARAAL